MALDAFASSDDVADRLGRTLNPAEEAQVEAFLDDASNLIRDFCRQDFNAQAGLVVSFQSPDGPWLTLPQRPVTSVTSVEVNGQTVGNWSQVGDRLYRVYGWKWPSVDTIPPLAVYGLISTVTVTYDAGYGTIPPIVVTITRNAAMRAFYNPSGALREMVDDYSREMVPGATGTGVFLTADEQKRLRRFRRGAFIIDMGSGYGN